jgi:cytochrome c553
MRKRTKILLTCAGLSFIIAVVLLFSGPRMRFQSSVRAFERTMPYAPDDVVSFYQDYIDTATLAFPAASGENLKKGEVYYSYYCLFCHGYDGKGNGEVGKSYIPKPADLSQDKIRTENIKTLYRYSFKGTGHSPVLERVVPFEHRPYILLYIRSGIK